MSHKIIRCVYPSCNTKLNDKDARFFAFPLQDKTCLKKWIKALGYLNFKPTLNTLICGQHFESDCINSDNILKPDAVPIPWIKQDDDEEVIDEFDVCRICGKAKNTIMTDIFDDDLDICEKISLCLPIVVSPHDLLPQTICDDCFEHLDIAAELVNKCLESETKLSKLFSTNAHQLSKTIPKPISLNGPLECDKCGVNYSDMEAFDEHMDEHIAEEVCQGPDENEVPLKFCSDCGHIFCEDAFYDEHKAETKMMCNKCEIIFENNCKLNNHNCFKNHSKTTSSEFGTVPSSNKHVLQNHNNRINNNCKLKKKACEASIKYGTANRNVNKRQKRKEQYRCNKCQINFTTNKELRDHCLELHGTASLSWICNYCGKSMTTKVSLMIHQRIHFNSKPFICEWCGSGFRSRANLSQHQVIHTGIRNHSCPVCAKKFTRKSFVTTHMRVHTGEKPYVCDICGHKFTQMGDMKRHRNRHQTPHVPAYPSDARYHACDICGDRFPNTSAFREHRLTHFNSEKFPITD